MLAVDGNSIINRAFYGVPLLSNHKGVYTNAVLGFMNIFLKVLDEEKPDRVLFAFDRKEPTFRHEIFDDYKAGRKSMPEELAQQMPIVKDLLSSLGYKVVDSVGYEADDILGTISSLCDKKDIECILLTGDRDTLQLVSKNVTVILPTTKKGRPIDIRYNLEKIESQYGVTPEGMLEIKALMGDSSDNIPGVKGVGEITATKLIQDYNSIEYIYENIEEIKLTPSVRKNLTTGIDQAKLSRELGKIIVDVPIDEDIDEYKKTSGDIEKTTKILNDLEMFSLLKRLDLPQENKAQEILKNFKTLEIESNSSLEDFLKNNKELFLYFSFENNQPIGLSLSNKKKYIVINGDQNTLNFSLEKILRSSSKIIAATTKDLFRYGFVNNISIKDIIFDLSLAGYILDPLRDSYDISDLAQRYLGTAAIENISCEIAVSMMVSLYPILCENISENEQDFIFYEVEMPLAKVLASMEILGFEVDRLGINNFGETLKIRLESLEKSAYSHADEEFNLNSPKQLGAILFDKLGLPVIKKTKTGYSTNAEVLEKLSGKHPIIEDIMEYRQLSKLNSTYVEGLLKVIEDDGRIHSQFNQTITRTGRISSTEPNLQNIPVRTDLGREMRRFFRAKSEHLLVTADYSQIELRVLSHIAKDENMQNAFKNGEDIHTTTASQVFNLPKEMVTSKMRNDSKAVNFGIVYGISAFSLSKDIGVSIKDAQLYIDNYLKNFSGVRQYMIDTVEYGKKHGYVKTLFSRRRDLPELKSRNFVQRSFGERVALNMPIQGTAADIIKIAMIKVYQKLKDMDLKARLILQIHDELIIETPEDEVEIVREMIKKEMESAVKLDVPLLVDVSVGPNWYETKE